MCTAPATGVIPYSDSTTTARPRSRASWMSSPQTASTAAQLLGDLRVVGPSRCRL
jgi:hypothetical protein